MQHVADDMKDQMKQDREGSPYTASLRMLLGTQQGKAFYHRAKNCCSSRSRAAWPHGPLRYKAISLDYTPWRPSLALDTNQTLSTQPLNTGIQFSDLLEALLTLRDFPETLSAEVSRERFTSLVYFFCFGLQ